METWGEAPDFDDVPWDEQFTGRDGIRHHYEELLHAFPTSTSRCTSATSPTASSSSR
jgi:hypothetical protein